MNTDYIHAERKITLDSVHFISCDQLSLQQLTKTHEHENQWLIQNVTERIGKTEILSRPRSFHFYYLILLTDMSENHKLVEHEEDSKLQTR